MPSDPKKAVAISRSRQADSELTSSLTARSWRDKAKRLSILNLSLLICLIGRVLPAEERSSDDAAEAEEQLKQLNDQTIIVSHLWLDTEWDEFKHGAEAATWTLGAFGDGVLAVSKTGLCGLRCLSFMAGAMNHQAI